MVSLLAAEIPTGLRTFTADQVLSPYVFVFYAAYIVAFLFTPIMRAIAIYYGIIDQPDGLRKMHTKPVAYLGGVAVFLGWLSGLAISQFLLMHYIEGEGVSKNLVINFGIVIAGCSIVLLGLWDDVLSLKPKVKILGQVAAAVCLLSTGLGIRSAWIFMQPVLIRTSLYGNWPIAGFGQLSSAVQAQQLNALQNHWIVLIASVILVIALVVGCCNATNLMDGLDGLCGGVTAVIAAGYLFLAVHLAMYTGALNPNQDALRVVLGLALLGGVLGFVPFNFNPASIFMGDTGSMFLGFCCATMMILFASETGHFKWLLASMVMFSLPTLDTALAFVRRWVNGRPLFSADRYHLHHQLVARGFSVKQTVLISYGLSLVFCILAGIIVYIRTRYAVGLYLVVFGSIIVAAYKMGMVHERVSTAARKPLGDGGAGQVLSPTVEPATVLQIREEMPTPTHSDVPVPNTVWKTSPSAGQTEVLQK